jgi:hypothetical protein
MRQVTEISMHRGILARLTLLVLLLTPAAWAQTDQNTTGPTEIDECGTLVRSGNCVLFEGGGGTYYVPNTGNFKVGDAVRVVGTLNPNCTTICDQADGCIQGATLYDPAINPCGQALPNFPGDIVTNACTAAAGSLLALTLGGLWLTRPRQTGKPKCVVKYPR